MLGTIPSVDIGEASRGFPGQRHLLSRALALFIEKESGESGHAGT